MVQYGYTHPCPNLNGDLGKPTLNLWPGWVIKSHLNLWMKLLIHVSILDSLWQQNGMASESRCVANHTGSLQSQAVSTRNSMSKFICSADQSLESAMKGPQDFARSHRPFRSMWSDLRYLYSNTLITIKLGRNHVFVAIVVAVDGIAPLGAKVSANTPMAHFRPCTCS